MKIKKIVSLLQIVGGTYLCGGFRVLFYEFHFKGILEYNGIIINIVGEVR